MSTTSLIADHIAVELPGATALFTTRRGGVSTRAVREPQPRPVHRRRPRSGRRTTETASRTGSACASPTAARFTAARVLTHTDPPPPDGHVAPDADGQATNLRGVAPMVLTADCVPIAIAGDGAVAMLHAGWRGLAANIVAEGVAALRGLGADGRAECGDRSRCGPLLLRGQR